MQGHRNINVDLRQQVILCQCAIRVERSAQGIDLVPPQTETGRHGMPAELDHQILTSAHLFEHGVGGNGPAAPLDQALCAGVRQDEAGAPETLLHLAGHKPRDALMQLWQVNDKNRVFCVAPFFDLGKGILQAPGCHGLAGLVQGCQVLCQNPGLFWIFLL